MKITKKELSEAAKLRDKGVDVWSLAKIYNVHYDTMRKYLRHYDLYGVSIFSSSPQYIDQATNNP
jgi:hypothetical protein